jgi:hypothetical protein
MVVPRPLRSAQLHGRLFFNKQLEHMQLPAIVLLEVKSNAIHPMADHVPACMINDCDKSNLVDPSFCCAVM